MTFHIPGTTLDCKLKIKTLNTNAAIIQNANFSYSHQINQGKLSPLFLQSCFESNFTKVWLLCNLQMRKQAFTWGNGLHSLFYSSNNINFYMLLTFSNVSYQLQLKLFQTLPRCQLVELRMVFTLTKAIHTTNSLSKTIINTMQ